MELQITWFILWAVLWAVYFMLDGFVLGTGMLSGASGKMDADNRVLLGTVGPVWNGNEVWLITSRGAAFPTTYALMLSYLYTALLFDNYLQWPILALIPLTAVASLIFIRYFMAKGAMFRAFTASCVTVLFVTFTGVAGLFPNLIPSSIDPADSLTIYNSSSRPYTLAIMTAAALFMVPIVIVYKIWVYRVFHARVEERNVLSSAESY
jgi:cytochrome bd-type quinol oxidase subunit 2